MPTALNSILNSSLGFKKKSLIKVIAVYLSRFANFKEDVKLEKIMKKSFLTLLLLVFN